MTQTIEQLQAQRDAERRKAIELILACNHGHLHGAIERRWCQYGGVGRALRFMPSGWVRLGQIFGWIEGLYHKDKELGITLANDFISRTDQLSQFGGWADEKRRVPQYLISLMDDGTLNGFSIAWHVAIDWREFMEKHKWGSLDHSQRCDLMQKNRIFQEPSATGDAPIVLPWHGEYDKPLWAYQRSFNGGYLYSGPGGDEIFAVRIGDHGFWSTHT